jgi:membrane protease YdiL (CAAX protease family)
MVISSHGTGYLEESYFRYYLLAKLRRALPKPTARIFLSTFLFSICHMYEGPWAVLNAAMAGFFLSVLFIRYRSLHGVSWAHAAHNMFVYTMGIFLS